MEKYANKQKYTNKYYSQGNTKENQSLQEMMNIHSDLNKIQPRAIKVCN